jgi:hypothetical protein
LDKLLPLQLKEFNFVSLYVSTLQELPSIATAAFVPEPEELASDEFMNESD